MTLTKKNTVVKARICATAFFSNLSPIFFNDNPFLISLFYCISFTGKFPDLSSKILLDFFHVPFLVFSFKGFPLIMQFFPFCKPYLHLHKSLLCIDWQRNYRISLLLYLGCPFFYFLPVKEKFSYPRFGKIVYISKFISVLYAYSLWKSHFL